MESALLEEVPETPKLQTIQNKHNVMSSIIMSEHITRRDRAAGFTLIEIVMVLVLLGILAAVAVPKYFDMQAESEEKACRYNQSVALETIYAKFAASKIDDGTNYTFDASSVSAATASAQAIVNGLATNQKNKKLCPSGGDVTADASIADDAYVFSVNCTIHGTTDGTSGSTGTKVTRENAGEVMGNWIKENYQLDEKWVSNKAENADMDAFFSKFDNCRGSIDSEDDNDNTITQAINEALKAAGLNADEVIWKIERTKGGPYFYDGTQAKNYEETKDGKRPHYEADLILTVANKSDITKNANGENEVTASIYKMRVKAGEKGTGAAESKVTLEDAKLDKDAKLRVGQVSVDGKTYLSLKTGNGADTEKQSKYKWNFNWD